MGPVWHVDRRCDDPNLNSTAVRPRRPRGRSTRRCPGGVMGRCGEPLFYGVLGLVTLAVIAALRQSRQAPAALVVMLLGGSLGRYQAGPGQAVQIDFRLPLLTPDSRL